MREKSVIVRGVSQGLALGPLQYLLYVNNIHNSRYKIFADDIRSQKVVEGLGQMGIRLDKKLSIWTPN